MRNNHLAARLRQQQQNPYEDKMEAILLQEFGGHSINTTDNSAQNLKISLNLPQEPPNQIIIG